ncbi:hypothetical protein RF11_01628 [Thelohanellus kitauei]|uniref:ER membrane protein complex subunit 6 n=1 Tax=Thelohanellus kitauei TaxID=669202 RepID=A0A0C2N1F2_THEKT|nr:hypothetical protein RF11_01628 [Thelohanellus kitauei]
MPSELVDILHTKGTDLVVLEKNLAIITDFKIYISIFSGMTAGIAGFTQLKGLLFYVICYLFWSLVLFIKYGNEKRFFTHPCSQLLCQDFFHRDCHLSGEAK